MDKAINGNTIANIIDQSTKAQVAELGITPKLAIIAATSDIAVDVWMKAKTKKASSLGIEVQHFKLTENVTTEELLDLIAQCNHDSAIHGIILQLPLYPHLQKDRNKLLEAISPAKDVDGLHPFNQGLLSLNGDAIVPATVLGIREILSFIASSGHYQFNQELNLNGSHVVIVNHSILIGKPLADLLLNANATVTIANEFTKELNNLTQQADILVTATGQVGLISHEYVKEDAIVIDVSTIQTESGLKGDVTVDEEFKNKVKFYTPVPGGVGPLTTSCLMANLVKAAKLQL